MNEGGWTEPFELEVVEVAGIEVLLVNGGGTCWRVPWLPMLGADVPLVLTLALGPIGGSTPGPEIPRLWLGRNGIWPPVLSEGVTCPLEAALPRLS